MTTTTPPQEAPEVKQVYRNGKWVSVAENNSRIFNTGVQPPSREDSKNFWFL